MSALFRSFSDSPLLQKIKISISDRDQIVQDTPLDQVVWLGSLEELDCTSNSACKVLPFLNLPRLKQLRVSSSPGPGKAQTLADLLPYDGRVLLTGVTEMFYRFDPFGCSDEIGLSGNGVDMSFCASYTAAVPAIIDWFFDQTWNSKILPSPRLSLSRSSPWRI